MIARLLAIAFLLASLLVPPFAEAAPSGAPSGPAVTMSAALDQDGGPGTPSRPHGLVHAGSHCACQLADRLTPPPPVGPPAFSMVVHPAFAEHAHASLEAEPPARPPQA
ncbi:hypothetical protein JYK14_08065 [Siccirubricoccus sp. KC 17139]|uniref:DUF2946 domain-containing protein n=1 Tax=Siccirubricoccus soli TaxID=2899147 RepID=A0ABT1D2I4_9PROT|nr:hypothetical protein [Siccirubricoccus soli]MCO6416120.1 hypothetical protein [Siccirubricoccus soli]MCP2682254.1 hypothetical protein [Siccirubricoccus soli]